MNSMGHRKRGLFSFHQQIPVLPGVALQAPIWPSLKSGMIPEISLQPFEQSILEPMVLNPEGEVGKETCSWKRAKIETLERELQVSRLSQPGMKIHGPVAVKTFCTIGEEGSRKVWKSNIMHRS